MLSYKSKYPLTRWLQGVTATEEFPLCQGGISYWRRGERGRGWHGGLQARRPQSRQARDRVHGLLPGLKLLQSLDTARTPHARVVIGQTLTAPSSPGYGATGAFRARPGARRPPVPLTWEPTGASASRVCLLTCKCRGAVLPNSQ